MSRRIIVAGMPTVGVVAMVRVWRGGDSKRRARYVPVRVHTVREHARVGFGTVVGKPSMSAVRVVFAERLHIAPCDYCPVEPPC